jgi:hypothetical protein
MPGLSEPDQQAITDALGPSRGRELRHLRCREIAELANLKRENRELKIALDRLRQSVSTIKCKDGVFIVGKGASEFVEFLAEIEKKIRQFESLP